MPDAPENAERSEPEAALIAPGAEFEGLLVLPRPARIEGGVRGTIDGTSVWIGRAGRIEGRVEAERLFVRGALSGSASARERIELRATARVEGSLEAASLVLEEGCVLEGSCRSRARGGAAAS
jgi:cytoskeletal protein CcmA (bactofilin family)